MPDLFSQPSDAPWTPSQLAKAARRVVEGAIGGLWVRGEISGLKVYQSGHWYFSLCDAQAQIRSVMWRANAAKHKTPPPDGTTVFVFGTPTVWEERGEFRLTVTQLLAAGEKLAAPPDFLELLLQQGLVVLIPGGAAPLLPSAPLARADTTFPQPTATLLEVDASKTERFMAARKMMNDSAVDGLGLRSFFFTLKLERCYNREDLLGLMGEYIKAIKKGSGEAAAEVLELRVRALLG